MKTKLTKEVLLDPHMFRVLDHDYIINAVNAHDDLLAALQELIGEWDAVHADEDHRTGYTLDTGGISMARAAIARATGAA